MKPRPIIVVWLFSLAAMGFFVVGLAGYFGRRPDGGAIDFALGAILLVTAVLVSRIFCKR